MGTRHPRMYFGYAGRRAGRSITGYCRENNRFTRWTPWGFFRRGGHLSGAQGRQLGVCIRWLRSVLVVATTCVFAGKAGEFAVSGIRVGPPESAFGIGGGRMARITLPLGTSAGLADSAGLCGSADELAQSVRAGFFTTPGIPGGRRHFRRNPGSWKPICYVNGDPEKPQRSRRASAARKDPDNSVNVCDVPVTMLLRLPFSGKPLPLAHGWLTGKQNQRKSA